MKMPIFLIEIVLANSTSYKQYRDVPDVDLNTYYQQMWTEAHKHFSGMIATFDVVQVSDFAHVALSMRERGETRRIVHSAAYWDGKKKRPAQD